MKKKALVISTIAVTTIVAGGWAVAQSVNQGPTGSGPHFMHGQGANGPGMMKRMGHGPGMMKNMDHSMGAGMMKGHGMMKGMGPEMKGMGAGGDQQHKH